MNLKLYAVCISVAIGRKVNVLIVYRVLGTTANSVPIKTDFTAPQSSLKFGLDERFEKLSGDLLNTQILMTQFRFQLYGIFDVVIPYEVILKQPIMKK